MLDFLPEQKDQNRPPATTTEHTFFSKQKQSTGEHTEALNNHDVSYRRTHYLIEVSLRQRSIYTWRDQARGHVCT